MPPGWYPDPFASGWLRWWDGTAWTSHQTTGSGPQATQLQPAPHQGPAVRYGEWQPTPRGDLAVEEKWAKRARPTTVLVAVLNIVSLVVLAPLEGLHLRHVFDSCHTLADGTVSCDGLGSGHQLLLQLESAPILLSQLLLMTWLFQAAKIARNIGLHARRQPAWAFGYFVPVVNLWFPYQVARDCLPREHPGRQVVGRWWATFLTQGLMAIPVLIVALFSTPLAAVIGSLAAIPAILAAWYGRHMITAILDEHRKVLLDWR